MPNYRVGRVSQEILREVNDTLVKKVRDPRVKNLTITDVELTGDLQNATIYYSTLDTDKDKQADTQTGLEKASGLIRKELGSRLTLYKTPELAFKRDESVEYGSRIDELLNKLNQQD